MKKHNRARHPKKAKPVIRFVVNFNRLSQEELHRFAAEYPFPGGRPHASYKPGHIQRLMNHIVCLEQDAELFTAALLEIAKSPETLPPDAREQAKDFVNRLASCATLCLQTMVQRGSIVVANEEPKEHTPQIAAVKLESQPSTESESNAEQNHNGS